MDQVDTSSRREFPVLEEPILQPYVLTAISATIFFWIRNYSHHSALRGWFYSQFKKAAPNTSETKLQHQTNQALARAVGCLHNSIQVPLALYVMCQPTLLADKLRGETPASRLLCCISAGYFLQDAIDILSNIQAEGPLYLVHAVATLTLSSCGGFRGAMQWYGAAFLLWELSTPFTYLRWFLAKTNRDDTQLYFWNGITMIVTFIGTRNVWGIVLTYFYFIDTQYELLSDNPDAMGPWIIYPMRTFNLVLNALNLFWASKMMAKLYRICVQGETQRVIGKDHDS